MVSHDRYLIERVCDSTWALFGDGKLTNLPGGIDEYLRRRAELSGGQRRAVVDLGEPKAADVVAAPKVDSATRRRLEKEMKSLERKMEKLRDQIAELHERMAANATDVAALTELTTESSLIREDIEAYELQWMELAEQLES